jgi:quercetin dioxygenase-like cupin family protein
MRSALLLAAAVAFTAVADAQTPAPSPAPAASPGIKRTILHRMDVEGGKEVVVGIAEIPAGMAAGRHTHPGVESGVVLSGSTSLEIEGETPRLLKEGDTYAILAGKVHDAKAVGDGPVKVLATYIVEKGKPFASPAK